MAIASRHYKPVPQMRCRQLQADAALLPHHAKQQPTESNPDQQGAA
jgi:hypothetical protein